MGIADLGNVLKIFGGSDISEEEQRALFEEVLLMVLARASSSDSSIQRIEIQTIRNIVERETGNAISEQDVRKAARTELYETTPLTSTWPAPAGNCWMPTALRSFICWRKSSEATPRSAFSRSTFSTWSQARCTPRPPRSPA